MNAYSIKVALRGVSPMIWRSLRYANLETLENGYGISLLPLATFAIETYADDPCERFIPKRMDGQEHTEQEVRLMGKMQKAMAIIQFKLEGQVMKRRPQYEMGDRLLLEKINYAEGTITLGDSVYSLLDAHFPTVDLAHPIELTAW